MKINPTINFNQDASSIIISDLNNLRILQIENQIELHEIYSSAILKDSSIAERLYNSSLLVVVRKKHPRTLKVYHIGIEVTRSAKKVVPIDIGKDLFYGNSWAYCRGF